MASDDRELLLYPRHVFVRTNSSAYSDNAEVNSKIRDIIGTIYSAVLHLPKPVRRVCIVQIAAFMGWFPYLFYSTTYVAEVMAQEIGAEPDPDVATRAGSLALLIYSFVAIIAGTLLPYLAARDRRLLRPDKQGKGAAKGARGKGGKGRGAVIVRNPLSGRRGAGSGEDTDEDGREVGRDSEESEEEEERDVEMERIREMVREWKLEAARQGRPLKLPTSECVLPSGTLRRLQRRKRQAKASSEGQDVTAERDVC